MIYLLVRKTNVCHGHGDYGDVLQLASPAYRETSPYPAFKTREAAEAFQQKLGKWHGTTIITLEVQS